MALKNKKAQMEIVALAFVVAGVVTIASAGLLSTGGGSKARSIYEQNFILAEQQISEIETFYSTLVNLAGRNVLKAEGYNLDDFCPASVKADDDLKDKIRKETDNLLSTYSSYEETKLPLMETASKKGILNVVPVGQASPYLKITGTPAEPVEVERGSIKLSSDGYFSAEIPATVKEIKPNFVVESIVFNDDPNVKSVEVNTPVKISAQFQNRGCGSVEDEFKYQIYNDATLITEGKAKGVPAGGSFGISETFTPKSGGTYKIIAKIDSENKIPESNEGDNEKTVSLLVTLPTTKSCSEVGGQCMKLDACADSGGQAISGSCGSAFQVCCKK